MSANLRSKVVSARDLPYLLGMPDNLTPEALATWTDEEVQKAWMESDWTPGDANADALAAEMVRRNLDF